MKWSGAACCLVRSTSSVICSTMAVRACSRPVTQPVAVFRVRLTSMSVICSKRLRCWRPSVKPSLCWLWRWRWSTGPLPLQHRLNCCKKWLSSGAVKDLNPWISSRRIWWMRLSAWSSASMCCERCAAGSTLIFCRKPPWMWACGCRWWRCSATSVMCWLSCWRCRSWACSGISWPGSSVPCR